MSNREAAIAFLRELSSCSCRSSAFYNKMDAMQKGIGFILLYLENADDEISPSDLAEKLNVTTARIAALLKKMERRGLVERHPSSHDGRRTIIRIMPDGILQANEMKEGLLKKIELLFEKMDRKDLEDFIRISKKMAGILEE